MKRPLKHLLLLCLLFPVCCATGAPRTGEEAVTIGGVPFFSQEAYQCGPTALAIVLDYWYQKTGTDKWLTPEQIAADIYSPTAKGILGIDLVLYGRKTGFEALQYSGNVADLRERVDGGTPVIILVDYGLSFYQSNHFMVVTGYSHSGVIVNSGRHENQLISHRELDRIWKKTDYWSLVLKFSSLQS
jgi:predicted double-glycine peptidase